MKSLLYIFFGILMITLISCDTNPNKNKKTVITYKIKLKTNDKESDTLWVSQNDSSMFRKEEVLMRAPDRSPRSETVYQLISPKNNAYYFIYDAYGQLQTEGKYLSQFIDENGINYGGNFYDSKSYSYRKNGSVISMNQQIDGRNYKTEIYNRKEKLEEVIYYEKKSGDRQKVEIYDDGKLKETRIYRSFENYDVIKAND